MNELFDTIESTDFIVEYFKKDDWYLLTRDLKSLIKDNINGGNKPTVENAVIKGDVYIGENCSIGSFVVIEGPVYIGNNVEIGSHAHIRPGSIIGDNCVVGYTAGTKNSLMMNGSKIANHAFIGDAILGPKARMGGHSETGNRRFDQANISWEFEQGKVDTALDKLGAIIGEGSRIGGGVLTSPGTVVGKNTFITAGANVAGYIPANKYVKAKIELDIRDNNFSKKLNQDSTLA